MNGAEKIIKAMKKVNESNQTIPSEIVSVTLTGINPFVFKVENRIEITPGFYELSNLVDWTKVEVGDVFKAFTFNEGQKYFILEGFTVASGGGGGEPPQPAPSSVIEQLKQSTNAVIPIGGGCDYFGATEPENFKFANGQALNIADYPELYAIIGETYRKEGNLDITTFNLPDKRQRVDVMLDNNSSTFNQLGKTGGEINHTLTTNEMPAHNHNGIQVSNPKDAYFNYIGMERLNASTWTSNTNNGSAGTYQYATYKNFTGSFTADNSKTENTGNGASHNITQPYLVCNYIIRVK